MLRVAFNRKRTEGTMVDIAAGYTALKTAYDIAKGLKDIDDRVKLNAAIIELQEKILAAQEATSEARDRLRELEADLAARDAWEATASRYVLKDYGGQTFAYELLPERADGEPIHRVCPSCFERRTRSILQHRFRDASQQEHYACPSCEKEFIFGVAVQVRLNYSPRSIV